MSQQATSAKKETAATKKTTAKSERAAKATEPSLNMQELRELAELVDAHGFTDFEFENETIRVRLSKQVAPPQIVQSVQPAAALPAAAAAAQPMAAKPETPHPGAKADAEAAADEDLYKIPSPIVGTFYRSPAPDKDPYIQIGSKVSPESVVCIIEAMKLMNEIQAEVSGEVAKIYVENGQPVEYGQPLFGIRK
jgi:acetyl-CoA carboxylase biotin carboxyl carrier protein